MTWRITTLTTLTPWTKIFATRAELREWVRSMDMVDGWEGTDRFVWETVLNHPWLDDATYKIKTHTHKVERIEDV